MTNSRPKTLDEYIMQQRAEEFMKAQAAAMSWVSGQPVSSAVGAVERGSIVSRVDRNKYDVHETFDAVLETLNAAIENIAQDLTSPGVAGISRGGLKSIRASFDSLVDVRNDFLCQEYEFVTAKPVPVPEVTPDSDGIIHDRYGNVVGRVATKE